MSASLYLLIIIIMLLIFFSAIVAKSSNEKDTFSDINTDEWECPNCSFHVQVGDHCIYCGASKEQK
tara:strand:- start:917 stop:1114 length:198 start_codon:yes stop_codon:yes gene_type:complete